MWKGMKGKDDIEEEKSEGSEKLRGYEQVWGKGV